MTTDDQLIKLAAKHRLGVYFSSKARRDGLPFIQILKDDYCLAEFHDLDDAFNWFPKNHLPDAAGKPIPSSANT